jgi:hypothetical protein
MLSLPRYRLAFSFVVGLSVPLQAALAEDKAVDYSPLRYKKRLAEQQQLLAAQQQQLSEQAQLLQQLKERLDGLQSPAPKAVPKSVNKVADAATALPTKPVGEAPPESHEKPRPPEIPRLSDTVGGVLTRQGKAVIEPAFEYGYTDNNRVFLDAYTFLPALAIGLIDIRQIKRHTFLGSVAARYGISDRWEVEMKAAYVNREDSQRSRPVSQEASIDKTFNASGSDLGDVEFSSRYQINAGRDGWPIFVGNIVTSLPTGSSPFDIQYVAAQGVAGAVFPTELPTGSGYVSIQPSITALYPSDPAVFFTNISYSYNLETQEKIGRYDAGDAIGLSFGMGFGMNEHSSFSLGYSHRHVLSSSLNGMTIPGSELDIGQLLVGYSFKYSPKTTFNLSLGVGTTNDAQSIRLNFRMPLNFDFISSKS